MSAQVAIDLVNEQTLRDVVNALVRLVEAAGAAVIFIGAVLGVVKLLAPRPSGTPTSSCPCACRWGRYLTLGLEFQLAQVLT